MQSDRKACFLFILLSAWPAQARAAFSAHMPKWTMAFTACMASPCPNTSLPSCLAGPWPYLIAWPAQAQQLSLPLCRMGPGLSCLLGLPRHEQHCTNTAAQAQADLQPVYLHGPRPCHFYVCPVASPDTGRVRCLRVQCDQAKAQADQTPYMPLAMLLALHRRQQQLIRCPCACIDFGGTSIATNIAAPAPSDSQPVCI